MDVDGVIEDDWRGAGEWSASSERACMREGTQ